MEFRPDQPWTTTDGTAITGIERALFAGAAGHDTATGGDWSDQFDGRGGADLLIGLGGSDALDGGTGGEPRAGPDHSDGRRH